MDEGQNMERKRCGDGDLDDKDSAKKRRKDLEFGDVVELEKYGMGKKLLEKMGYTGGGLGKNQQGIVDPIEATLRPKKMGIGFNDNKEAQAVPTLQEPEQKKPLCGTSNSSRRSKLRFKQNLAHKMVYTKIELLPMEEEEGCKIDQGVIDMRGPEVCILSDFENLNAKQEVKEKASPMSEIQYNIRLILDRVEIYVRKLDKDLRNDRETVVRLQMEKGKLQKKASWQKKQLDSMEDIVGVLERIVKENSLGTLTIDSLLDSFSDLQQKYRDEYNLCNLSCIAPAGIWSSMVNPRICRVLDSVVEPILGA